MDKELKLIFFLINIVNFANKKTEIQYYFTIKHHRKNKDSLTKMRQ